MCTIYEFPKQIALPRYLEKRLRDSAKEYVLVLNDVIKYFEDGDFNEEDLAKFMELMLVTYLETIDEAIEELIF